MEKILNITLFTSMTLIISSIVYGCVCVLFGLNDKIFHYIFNYVFSVGFIIGGIFLIVLMYKYILKK